MNKTVYNKQNCSVRILYKSDPCPISGKWLIPANCTEELQMQVKELKDKISKIKEGGSLE